jgi:hypothetical protein
MNGGNTPDSRQIGGVATMFPLNGGGGELHGGVHPFPVPAPTCRLVSLYPILCWKCGTFVQTNVPFLGAFVLGVTPF